MTRKEAMEYNESLKKELEHAALQYGLEESASSCHRDLSLVWLE